MSNLINLTSKLSSLSQEYIEAQHSEKSLTDIYDALVDKFNSGDESITDEMLDVAYNKMMDSIDLVESIADQIADIEEEIDELNNSHDSYENEDW